MKTKTYVVTGSTSGIGKALLERIAADNVVLPDIEINQSLKSCKLYRQIFTLFMLTMLNLKA